VTEAFALLDAYRKALEGAITAVSRLDTSSRNESSVSESGRDALLSTLGSALLSIDGTDPLITPRAADLERVLVDAESPRDPKHFVFEAFEQVERTRREAALATGRLGALPGSAIRELVEGPGPGRTELLRWSLERAVFLVPFSDASTALYEGSDGALQLAAFTEHDLAERWRTGLQNGFELVIERVAVIQAAERARRAGAPGIVVNPLSDNVSVSVAELATAAGWESGVRNAAHVVYASSSREHHYSLGRDLVTGHFCLSIPVTIGVVDYEEHYAVTPERFERLLADSSEALRFADECRARQHDALLIQKPGWNRGIPY
jgi:hypothetical protein